MKTLLTGVAFVVMLLPVAGCAVASGPGKDPAHNIPVTTAPYYTVPTNLTLLPTAVEPVVYLDWVKQFGSGGTDYGYDLALDSAGNAYVTGYTIGAFPGQTYYGVYDAFLRKYDTSGTMVWTRQFGTEGTDIARSVASDGRNGIYLAGYTNSSLPGQTSAGSYEAFVRKYDESGNLIWTRQFGTVKEDDAYGVAVDRSANCYVVGTTTGTFPGQISGGKKDCFIAKLDSSGNLLWTRQLGSAADDFATNVCLDSLGGVMVVGYTDGTLLGQTASGYEDSFICKYNDSGSLVWLRQFGSKSTTNTFGVASDSSGYTYVCGWVFGPLVGDLPSYAKDGFVRKYDSSGSVVWTRQFADGGDIFVYDVHCDSSGGVYITGSIGGELPGQKSYSLTMDLFIRKYTAGGAITWTCQQDSLGNDTGYAIDVDSTGDIFISGITNGKFQGQTNPDVNSCALVAKFSLHSPLVGR